MPIERVHGHGFQTTGTMRRSPLQRKTHLLRAGLAGALATIPMTAVMVLWHRRLPAMQREPLPPAQVTESLLASVGLHDDLTQDQKLPLVLANHFAYGAAMGGLYGVLAGPRARHSRLSSGVLYGLTVWGANYLGLLPSFELYRSAKDEPVERNILMIAAHIVWGASLGALMEVGD